MNQEQDPSQFTSYDEFYNYYLSEHQNPICRGLHYVGSSLVIAIVLLAISGQRWSLLWLLPLIGYGFAWVGHFFFEKNKPATFKAPFRSFISDWVMLKDFLTGQIAGKLSKLQRQQISSDTVIQEPVH